MAAFTIGFDYDGPFMGCNTYFSNRRAKKGRIAFGDQGIFMTRELFLQQNGFPDLPLMEDYELSLRMKRAAHPAGGAGQHNHHLGAALSKALPAIDDGQDVLAALPLPTGSRPAEDC